MNIFIKEHPHIDNIFKKIENGERLNKQEGLKLLTLRDLHSLGYLATIRKKAKSSNYVYFVVNRQINPTNICKLRCKFCEYAVSKNHPKAYELTVDEILNSISPETREVHIVSALHPEWKFDRYLEIVREIKKAFPKITIKAYTAVEIHHFSTISGLSIEKVLEKLKEAGVVQLPGGGAEVFSDRIRKELFPQKIGYREYLHIHKTAHRLGIKSNATILYGHIERPEEIITHFELLREAQDETNGFLAFIPLEYIPGKKKIVKEKATAEYSLRIIALSRLMLDNFPHIKAYWVTLGEELAEISLHFGADDLDGTIGKESIMHSAETESPEKLTMEKLIHLIKESGYIPVERDALYNIIKIWN